MPTGRGRVSRELLLIVHAVQLRPLGVESRRDDVGETIRGACAVSTTALGACFVDAGAAPGSREWCSPGLLAALWSLLARSRRRRDGRGSPLGPREPFVPWYKAGLAHYVNRVNVSNIYNRDPVLCGAS